LGIVLPKRLGDFDFGAFEDADELEGVDDGLALKVIVGDDKGVAGVFGDFANARDPRSEFFRGIEIIVALVGRDGGIVREPGIVTPTVEADIADGRSGFRGGRERAANDRLIDVAEAGVVLPKESESLWGIPGAVADFDDERVIGEALEHGGEIGAGFLGPMERERELKEDGAEFVGDAKNVKAGTDGALVVGASAGVVREFLPEFGGEEKSRIGGDAGEPIGGMIGTQRMVERSVDLDGVEESGKILGLVESFGPAGRIYGTRPVRIRPACGADA
jgi:hypothetical protein